GRGVGAKHLEVWRKALEQVVGLHARLFDDRPRSIAGHVRRLRDELSRLNPDDLRADERELMKGIIEALERVVGDSDLLVDAREMGGLMVGVARGEQVAEDAAEDAGRVWVGTPETIDCTQRDVVFYLGVDAARVPRPAGMAWPFFEPNADADAERERY